MIQGPFSLEITNTATKVDFSSLPNDVQLEICKGFKYDPVKHNVYSFSIAPKELLSYRDDLPRAQKMRSYTKVDRVIVQARSVNSSINFWGIYPTTKVVLKEKSIYFDKINVNLETSIPKYARLKISSVIKNAVRSDKCEIFAASTDNFAQWIFLENWIKSGKELSVSILCSVPKTLNDAEKYIVCDVEAQQKGRRIAGSYHQHVKVI